MKIIDKKKVKMTIIKKNNGKVINSYLMRYNNL